VKKALAEQPSKIEIVAPPLKVIVGMSEEIKKLDLYVKAVMTAQLSATKQLMQVPGVGALSAVSFILAVDDPHRFKDPRDVAAYLGLVPRRDQSGEIDKQLPISKAGNKQIRTLLVQCAQYIMRPNSPDSDLKRHGERIAKRGGRISKRKAIVAVARKLSVVLLTLWQKESDYVPLKDSQGHAA